MTTNTENKFKTWLYQEFIRAALNTERPPVQKHYEEHEKTNQWHDGYAAAMREVIDKWIETENPC